MYANPSCEEGLSPSRDTQPTRARVSRRAWAQERSATNVPIGLVITSPSSRSASSTFWAVVVATSYSRLKGSEPVAMVHDDSPAGIRDQIREYATQNRQVEPGAPPARPQRGCRGRGGSGYVPDRVLCATAQRARETWQLAEEGLGADPPTTFEDRGYGASAAELLDPARPT